MTHRHAIVVIVVALLSVTACSAHRPQQVVNVTQYNNGAGVPLYVSADAENLTGAPKDFKTFIAKEARHAIEHNDGTCGEPPVYTVKTVTDTGFAGGTLSECGIQSFVWAKQTGSWSRIITYDTDPQCADLKTFKVPAGVTGNTCRDSGGLRPYTG